MADRITLKSYFQTGDKPTQAQFAELINSLALTTELSSANLATLAQALAGIDNTKAMSPFLVKSVLLDWIVNNLTSGGTQKLLSAEQGKVLQNTKPNRTYTTNPLNATERESWRNGLGIIRHGSSKIGNALTVVTGFGGAIFFTTIPGFDPLVHKLFVNVIAKPTNQGISSWNPLNRSNCYVKDYKDSYFKYDVEGLGSSLSNPPVDVYLNWFILEN